MAEAALNDVFRCSVCLDQLKDPVSIPCGHNYCMSCINGCWDQEDQKGVYSCPQCRETFRPRPVLRKNTMLAELVEQMEKTAIQASPSVPCYAGPGDVACDFCTERKLKAVRSCLGCLASMCETHIQPHYDVPALKKHKLVKATSHLQDRICAKHDKLLEVFCRTDQTSICILCIMDEHQGHETISAAAERAEKQRQVGEMQNQLQQKVKQTEKNLQKRKESLSSYKKLSEEALAHTESIFTELAQSIERKGFEVKELILAQQKLEVSQAEGILMFLEQEIAALRRREVEWEELSREEDNVIFIQNFHTIKSSPILEFPPIMTDMLSKSFQDLRESLSTLKQKVENICETCMVNITKKNEDWWDRAMVKDTFKKEEKIFELLSRGQATRNEELGWGRRSREAVDMEKASRKKIADWGRASSEEATREEDFVWLRRSLDIEKTPKKEVGWRPVSRGQATRKEELGWGRGSREALDMEKAPKKDVGWRRVSRGEATGKEELGWGRGSREALDMEKAPKKDVGWRRVFRGGATRKEELGWGRGSSEAIDRYFEEI